MNGSGVNVDDEHEWLIERAYLMAEREDEHNRALLAATYNDDEVDDEDVFADEPRDDTYDMPDDLGEDEPDNPDSEKVWSEQDDPELDSPAVRDKPLPAAETVSAEVGAKVVANTLDKIVETVPSHKPAKKKAKKAIKKRVSGRKTKKAKKH
jgi:hypothetical protein